MQVNVVIEHRFYQTSDGSVWTHASFDYSFWKRYLEVFDNVNVIARVQRIDQTDSALKQSSGPGVTFKPVPYYVGFTDFLLNYFTVKRTLQRESNLQGAYVLRVGSALACYVEPVLRRAKKPFGLEVVGDPYDVFSQGSVAHPLRPLFRWYFTNHLRYLCQNASCISYVTEQSLQKRYPPSKDAYSTYYSSIDLQPSHYSSAPRKFDSSSQLRLCYVGTLDQLYKAPDILVEAFSICIQQNLNTHLVIVGDGKHRTQLEKLARAKGISSRISFVGTLPAGDAVRQQLDDSDMYVLPSRQEGLPRSLLEAMARGLPCIGSNVGGVPELLPPDDRVPAGDAIALANKIQDVASDRQRMNQMASRNWSKSKEYLNTHLQRRRAAYYQELQRKTAEWEVKAK